MPYLSRIRINPLRAQSRRLLASPHVLHGAVQGGFPGPPGAERTLWRLDADDPHRPHVYVLSRSRPDWTHIVESAGWPGASGEHAAVRDYGPLLKRLAEGQEYAFRLTANPVRNTADPEFLTPSQARKLARVPEGPGSVDSVSPTARHRHSWAGSSTTPTAGASPSPARVPTRRRPGWPNPPRASTTAGRAEARRRCGSRPADGIPSPKGTEGAG